MRRTAQFVAILGVHCMLVHLATAGEDQAAAIINKSIKAHFPNGLDTKNQGLRTKTKGTLHVAGLDLPFTQEVSVQAASKFKEVMELTVMNKKVTVTTTFDGKNGKIVADDKEVKVTDEILNELKEAAYSMGLMQGLFLKDKSVKLSLVGDVKVKDKPAVGVTVSREGKKDINLFFDKGTGLVSKVEMRKRDLMSGQEVTEERFITEYQEVSGRMVAKKVEVLRDGKELMEAEVLDVQVLPGLEDSEFALPK
jgi:hypothetical protein